VVSYFTLSLALTAYTTFIEKDTIAQTRGKAHLMVRSKMPRFQDVYTLGIRPKGSKSDSPEEVKLSSSVGAYFDGEGILAVDVFKAEVADLLGRLEASSARGEAKKSQ
jgi:Microsomal signal peptidase 25 kDa subunit (SPC25)